jgi:Mrp family chromosome partitioning ATPase
VTFVAARPDGATTLAVALAARLSEDHRVLLVDLNLDRPEVAPLLDVDESPNVYQLAYQSRLAPVGPAQVEAQVQWREGMGVLAGSWLASEQRAEITDSFVDELLTAAAARFDHVVVDLGRPRATLPGQVLDGVLAWVVTPSPLGVAALDRSVAQLEAQGRSWKGATLVLNRVSDSSWRGVDRLAEREYQMLTAGQVPLVPAYLTRVEVSHSLAALRVPVRDRRRFLRAYGAEAWSVRQAVTALAGRLVAQKAPSTDGRREEPAWRS